MLKSRTVQVCYRYNSKNEHPCSYHVSFFVRVYFVVIDDVVIVIVFIMTMVIVIVVVL